jgi:hypothetical protein
MEGDRCGFVVLVKIGGFCRRRHDWCEGDTIHWGWSVVRRPRLSGQVLFDTWRAQESKARGARGFSRFEHGRFSARPASPWLARRWEMWCRRGPSFRRSKPLDFERCRASNRCESLGKHAARRSKSATILIISFMDRDTGRKARVGR